MHKDLASFCQVEDLLKEKVKIAQVDIHQHGKVWTTDVAREHLVHEPVDGADKRVRDDAERESSYESTIDDFVQFVLSRLMNRKLIIIKFE